MNQEEFVLRMREEVRDSAARGIIKLLKAPPGRRPHADLVKRSAWFNDLSVESQEMVTEIVAMAAHATLFGFFCVLDGVRAWDHEGGRLKLTYLGADNIVLNQPGAEDLHDYLGGLFQ